MTTVDDATRHDVLAAVMLEYASAIRGDWSNFDGRTERNVIESWVDELRTPSDTTIDQWRQRLGLCLDGGSHWRGIGWGNCHAGCPTAGAEEAERRGAE